MRFSLPLLALSILSLAPADSARAGGVQPIVAEIVTFQIVADMDDASFITLAQATQVFVGAAPGFISRQLSKGEDGIWTDYILWQDLTFAKAAAELVVQDPAFGPFGQAILMESVKMRHENVKWQVGD